MTGDSAVPAELVAAYRATHFAVEAPAGGFVLRVGIASPELGRLYAATGRQSAAYLTAWNPESRSLPAAENDARQAELAERIRQAGLPQLPGVGRDPEGRWPGEGSLLVLGIDQAAACDLGREFGQNAILWIGPDTVPDLVLLR